MLIFKTVISMVELVERMLNMCLIKEMMITRNIEKSMKSTAFTEINEISDVNKINKVL